MIVKAHGVEIELPDGFLRHVPAQDHGLIAHAAACDFDITFDLFYSFGGSGKLQYDPSAASPESRMGTRATRAMRRVLNVAADRYRQEMSE
jgi:hypothetical protein